MADKEKEYLIALQRADHIITVMADYIGNMAISAETISALNEHWLFMERLKRIEE